MKYALLIGINYKGQNGELNGCINDVHKIRNILVSKFGFKSKNIVMLTDNTKQKPTAQNIINELSNLVFKTMSNPNSEIWIHYSGHGASILDSNSDEADGMDEVLIPLDYEKNGIITDDTLHNILCRIPKQSKCICFFDCCHSGTILDLKYKYKIDGSEIIDNPKAKTRAKIFMISGCKDNQTSADFFNSKCSSWAGAMTTIFIKTLEDNKYNLNCLKLLEDMRTNLVNDNFTQIPQMTSSFHIKNDTIFCSTGKNSKGLLQCLTK